MKLCNHKIDRLNPPDFLRHIIANVEYCDTHIGIKKEELFEWCRDMDIPLPPKNTIKSEVIDYLIDNGASWTDFYVKWKNKAFGIHPTMLEKKFGLSKSHRKKMEEQGFLKVAYTVYTKVFTNTYADVPYYDAEQYFLLTDKDIENWKMENIRGYKKRQESKLS